MKLHVKFGLLVALVVAVALGITARMLIRHQQQALQDQMLHRAQTVLSFGESCREYTAQTLRPAVARYTRPANTMLLEAESATFVTRGTFEALARRQPGYAFREASLNPLNDKNRADADEEALIRRFRDEPGLPELSGFRQREAGEQFYVARPIVVERQCLRCHSTPESAPAALVQRYGTGHGYGWKPGEVNSVILVAVPTQDVRAQQASVFWKVLGTFAGLGVVLAAVLTLSFEHLVNRRLRRAAGVMGRVAADPACDARLRDPAADELGTLATAFDSMADGLRDSHVALEERVAGRTEELSRANAALAAEVAERRRAEADLQRAMESAEAGSRAKSEFLANMSHEIRTPMNGILGMTELALDTELSAEQHDYLRTVKSSADALLAILNDVLDFSKIEAGKLDLDPVDFPLREVVADSLKPLALRAHEKGLELTCEVQPDVPERVVGDPDRLRQVLVNLVGNAVKFTEHGEVAVRVERGEESGDKLRVLFRVADTGIGIPAEQQPLIFQPFTQADGSTTRKYGGTGLGLTISARLVGMMGGRLGVESEVGRGSTFHFDVWLGRGRGTRLELLTGKPAGLAGLAVLVVDDNATNRGVLGALLRHWDARPAEVDGGLAALAELRRAAGAGKPYPLLLVDAMMPGMDSFTLVEQVLREPELAGPTIMMLTSSDRSGDARRCRQLGVAAYLVKPINPAELQEAIALALRGGRGVEERRRADGPPPGEARPARPLRVLLAEDNAVNQQVVVGVLTKRGHAVAVARDGREALAALGREPFDLVLMDVQMPGMGGLEATAHLREREKGTGGHVPVIALTAHAMKGDRERCLAAGMDDYISKPIQAAELLRAVDRVAGAGGEPAPPPGAAFDEGTALERVGGDPDLLAEVVAVFRKDAPQLLESARQALARGDVVGLKQAAHALKGAVGYVGGDPAVAVAQRLEQAAAGGDLSGVPDAWQALEDLVERLTAALAGWRDPSPA